MAKSIFKRGYEASREEQERQKEAKKVAGKKLWDFYLKDDKDEADLRFLTEEPVNFLQHQLKVGGNKYEQFTCTGEGCELCADGDKPQFKGAYLVVDHREFEYTKDGKKQTGRDQVRMFIQGMKVVSQLDRLSNKYGITNRDLTMIRLGTGTGTTYTLERGDEDKLSSKQIKAFLPEQLRESFDGTTDSLYAIVEEQLLMRTKGYTFEEDADDDDDEDDNDGRNGLISEDDEEEEVKPKKKLGASKKKPMFKKAQNSVKPKSGAKSLLKKKSNEEELPFN